MSFHVKNIALAALCCALMTGLRAWANTAKTNPVTGETETYVNKFIGGTEEWNSGDNWDTGNTPFVSGGNFDSALVDGKAASTSTAIDGWALRVGAYNGASVTWSGGITKIQGSTTGCWLTADKTSSITIASFAGNQLENNGNDVVFKLTSAKASGITWSSGLSSASGYQNLEFQYYLGGDGTVVYGGDVTVDNPQVIKQADITLSGGEKAVTHKTLVAFGSGTTKTFTANAAIKRLNSAGNDLNNNALLATVNTTGTTTLTTSDSVGKCELVQTSTGIELFWVDGNPEEIPSATVYKPSININFTNGAANGLTTGEDVGLAGYAVPGISWNNYVVANSTFSSVNSIDSTGAASLESGVSVTVSGSRGSYSCSNLTPATNPLHGYIDENAGNPTPTITVTGIPYYKYRVIVYHSTDTENVPFGYDTINGTNYTYENGDLVEDTTAWGSSGPDYGANAIAEGGNALVTGELSGSTLTVVGHRAGGASNARGCIAAIQIIEIKPDITKNDLEIPVSGDMVYTVSEEKILSGTVYLTGNGTLTLGGSSKISAATIDVGASVTLNVNAERLDATTFTGAGTVVYNNSLPETGKGWTESAWAGTVWINGKSGVTDFNVNSYGNANSAVKLSGVDGWVSAPFDNTIPVILENGTFDYALKLTGGNAPDTDNPTLCTTFAKLSGGGTISDGGVESPMLKMYDVTEFTGSIASTCARFVFCSATSTTLPEKYYDIPIASIYIDAGNSATVASGKTWSANGGFIVEGTLMADGTLASSAEVAVSGGGTVTFSGVPSPIGDAWWKNTAWAGTVEIKAVTNLNGNDYIFNNYGNTGSTLKLTDCSGWLKTNYTCVPALEIGGTFTWNDGGSGLNNTFKVATLKGSGTISIPNQGAVTAVWQITDDWSGFTGPVVGNNSAARRVLVFGPTLPTTISAGDIYVSEGATLDLDNSSGAWWGVGVRFVVDGTVKASARTKWGGGTAMMLGDTGVLELVTGSSAVNDIAVDYSNVTGTGTVRYTGSNWRSLPDGDNMFATTLSIELENNTGVVFNGGSDSGSAGTIGSIFGTKNLRNDLGGYNKVLTVKQAKDGVWSGSFLGGNDRLETFIVDPGATTTGTLTIAGTHTHDNKMTVNGSVNITGTWVGATTVSGMFGGTGTLTGNLTFNAGSRLKVFGIDEDGLAINGTITYPDDGSKVKVDLSAVNLEGFDYIPLFKVAAVDISRFELDDKALMFDFVFEDGVLGLELNDNLHTRYSDHVTFTLNNIGSTIIPNYTLLVRISEKQFPGFSYASAGDGSELAFTDGGGSILNYDIDVWNTQGESLVWVKVPKAVDGNTITFYWSLKDGESAPENNSEKVWSDYAGVWHMSDAKDASGNSDDGTLHANAVPRSDGKFGAAYGRTETGVKGPIATIPKSDAMDDLPAEGEFTVSAWVRFNSNSALDYPYFFSRKDGDTSSGWGVQLGGGTTTSETRIWPDGTAGNMISFSPAYRANDWVYMSVVFGNGYAQMFVDGVQYGPTQKASFSPVSGSDFSFYIGGAGADDDGSTEGRVNTLNGYMDEVRLYKGAVSPARAKAEYENANQTDFRKAISGDGVSFLVPGVVFQDGVEWDYFLSAPIISPNYWCADAPPDVDKLTYIAGVLRSGAAVTNWCENLLTHEMIYDVSPENLRNLPVGSYRMHCARKDTENVTIAGETSVDFTIAENSGTASVGDTAGGRILLMNNDFSQGGDATVPFIGYQGYSDTNVMESAYCYWEFPDGFDEITSALNPMPGTNSILWSVSDDKSITNKLWHLVSSRHGNTFPKDGAGLSANQNYLPWSEMSCSITNGTVAAKSGADAGQILMLNTTEAAIYSPCYEEGIGTIYFDAVNGWNDDLTAYQLIVECATATMNGDSVVDANLWQYDDDGNVTNYYGNLDATCWRACDVNVARISGGDTIISKETYTAGAFNLEVGPERPTTTGEFYRVYAQLNIREPVRFRIRRTTIDSANAASKDASYLLLDNIIVSYPAMTATLSPAGWYDETKKGINVLGFESAFTKPFPAVGDSINGKAAVNYYVNSSQALTETNFIASAKMFYRWRYLKHFKNDSEWKSAELNPGDDFRSTEPLDLPDGVGDVEFWYEYILQAPYYSYVDYTGLPNLGSAFSAIYTEAILGPQTNRADVALNDYPTWGTDWFVRLRRNASAYEGFKLHARSADNSFNATIDMSLAGKGTWRGFVPTLEPLEDGLFYRIEGLNPQSGEEWLWSTNYFSAVSNGLSKVVTTTSVAGEPVTNNWGWAGVECDAATGHLMFQLDENSLSLTITHADYQNINKWHDAHDPDGSFVGSSVANDSKGKSGTSHKTRDFDEDFEGWADTPLTKADLWEESFEFAGITTAKSFNEKGLYEPFDSIDTPNMWQSGPGMWVYSRHYNPNHSDHWALQMKGLGSGYLMFSGGDADKPYGIGSVSYKARLAQQISLDTMSYDDNASRGLTNYTFFSYASLRDNPTTDNFDGDASVSVIAYYIPHKGCYEFRATQNDDNSLMLSIYRWNQVGATNGKATLLAQQKFNSVGWIMKMANSGNPYYGGLFISVSNATDRTCIITGVMREPGTDGYLKAANVQLGNVTWIGLTCEDTSKERLTSGRYGLTSKSCPALFWNPRHCEREVTLTFTPSGNVSDGEASVKKYYDSSASGGNNKFQIDGVMPPRSDAVNSLKAGNWAIDESRFEVTNIASSVNWGLAAKTVPQKVAIEWAPAGKATGFSGIVTNEVVSYAMSNYTVPVYLKNDASLRLKMVGNDNDARADVVVDNISFTQFRGGTMGKRDAESYAVDDGYGYRTNFYFSSCIVTNNMLKMSARRTLSDGVCAIRSPLMDGTDGRGIGLGMFSFEYRNAQTNTTLILQIATNVTQASAIRYNEANGMSLWHDVTNFTFTADTEDLEHGTRSFYLGLHEVKGMMRIIVDPDSVAAVDGSDDPSAFGEIDIEKVFCRDEPVLDDASWWGFNVRSLNWDYTSAYDDGTRTILHDYNADPGGMSLALNNSIADDTKPVNGEPDPSFAEHMPFVQTPTFKENIVGEVSFVARRFDNDESAQYAEVALYGAKAGMEGLDANWVELARFVVSNTTYETYTYQMQGASGYSAFRLGVTGVYGIENPDSRGKNPECGPSPVRVMVDEIAVFEAVWPTMGFRYVYPFRTNLDKTTKHEGVVDSYYNPLMDEQPLAGERWTVQAEIFAKQLPDELDLTTPGREPKVLFYWYPSARNWGYKNWKKYATPVELARADGETMVFRGSLPKTPDAIVPGSEVDTYEYAQYMAEVVYWTVNGRQLTNEIDQAEWVMPPWYYGNDFNAMPAYGKKGGFSPFTILDTIAPKRVWFNEVNIYDGDDGSFWPASTNQYIELAVPQRQSIKGWRIEYINSQNNTTNTLCTFGEKGVSAEKDSPATNGYAFITVQCPEGRLSGYQADGKWDYDEMIQEQYPVAFRLLRPSDVVEQEIVLEGTNFWASTHYAEDYSSARFVEVLNANGGHFYAVGDESIGGIGDSLGVTNGTGAAKADWTSPMPKTPGEANYGQVIPENYVIIPNSLMLEVSSKIGERGFGHVRQTFGTLVDAAADTRVMTLKGEGGTNIVYTIDKWWEIASLKTNGVEVSIAQSDREGPGEYTLKNVGAGASNDISVVVTAQPLKTLREDWGLTEDNRYFNAVMDWLASGVTQRGDFVGSSIVDAHFKGLYSGSIVTNLTLVDRYWLDIDPTQPGWVLRGGVLSAPEPGSSLYVSTMSGAPSYEMVDSFKITVKMMITNELNDVAYAPYVLRGLAPGSQSTDINPGNWTSVTFKVTGDIQNVNVNRIRWVPLRRFVFTGDGNGNSYSFDDEYKAVIEIYDPKTPASGSTRSWSAYPSSPVFYGWSIDERGSMDTPIELTPDSTFPTQP